MIECPRCGHRFPENLASQQAFEAFHAIRDEYARANGLKMPEAKDMLCIMYGVAQEYGDEFKDKPPTYPGVFCRWQGRLFFRKSTLAYTPEEMHHLIEASAEAVGGA